jgi:excisionase family DNA binding protein
MSNQANSVKRAAEKLNVSDRKVWQLIARGDLRAIKIDRRTLVTDRQIDEFLREREQVA